ncbi:YfhO family protein [Corynebacterium poyangense]|uniref:YfhO family protein n=1 Tax=Corynebacterium poyangense TaxID=2684405 RepID=UPI001CCCB2B6|nr:YfhO family protein [Corynebacterium poyangense]
MTRPRRGEESELSIPLPLRVGGAFIAIALALVIFLVLEIAQHGWLAPVEITSRMVLILCAAALVGAFATVRRNQRPGVSQVIALTGAVVLVILSRFLPSSTLFITAQTWMLGWAILALMCAVILRRSVHRR